MPMVMIAPGGLLRTSCLPRICSPSFSFMGGVATKVITTLGCEKYFVQSRVLSTTVSVFMGGVFPLHILEKLSSVRVRGSRGVSLVSQPASCSPLRFRTRNSKCFGACCR
jgi:hypothetical protein